MSADNQSITPDNFAARHLNSTALAGRIIRILMTTYCIASATMVSVTRSENDFASSTVENKLEGHTACTEIEADQLQCRNGGKCFAVPRADNFSNRTIRCRCVVDWTGDVCQYVHIAPMINASYEERTIRARVSAAICVCLLVFIVALISLYVFIRYRHKKRQLADQWLKATADELYRRPFNGRSSVVVSLSRVSSLRRAGSSKANNRDGDYTVAVAAGNEDQFELCADSKKHTDNDKSNVNDHVVPVPALAQELRQKEIKERESDDLLQPPLATLSTTA